MAAGFMAALDRKMAEQRRGFIVTLRNQGLPPLRIALAVQEAAKIEARIRARFRDRLLAVTTPAGEA